jgi:hypothetical protein
MPSVPGAQFCLIAPLRNGSKNVLQGGGSLLRCRGRFCATVFEFNGPLPVPSLLALLGTVDSVADVGEDTVSGLSQLVHLEICSMGMNASQKTAYTLKNCIR